jgi:threonine/homoserine/homoserine lactone efflux protein
MLKYVILGGSIAFAAAVQPGPLQAFLLSRVAAGGWRRTLPAALSPVISDGPIAFLMLLMLHRLAGGLENLLKAAGGLLLLYFAWRALAAWRSARQDAAVAAPSAPRTLLQAVAVNLVNPGPYLGWSLVLGPLAIEAWRLAPRFAVALVASFYAAMVATLALIIFLFGATAVLGPQGRRVLLLASSLVLAGLGGYQLFCAVP